MEERSKRIWLVVGIIAVLSACCLAATAATVGGLMTLRSRGWTMDRWERGAGEATSQIERTLKVGREPVVRVDNFAGSVSVSPGDDDTVHVVATKRVTGGASAANVRVDISQEGDRVIVTTEGRPGLRTASVRIEITAPKDTVLDLHTGAGSVSVIGVGGDILAHSNAGAISIEDVQAQIDASTNAGSVTVQGASGTARLKSNAGSIKYAGSPSGQCNFETNAGSIRLDLPDRLDMEIDLNSTAGSVSVDHRLSNTVSTSRTHVKGTIGDGSDGRITATTNAGSITVRQR